MRRILDAIADGKSGDLIDPHDYETLSDKTGYLYKNPIVLKEMRIQRFKCSKQEFNWKIICNKLIEVFSELMRN